MHEMMMRLLWRDDGTCRLHEVAATLLMVAFMWAGAMWAAL